MPGLRSEGEPDDLAALWNVGHLPGLAAHGTGGLDFAVKVGLGDTCEKLAEREANCRLDDELALLEDQVDVTVLAQAQLLGERTGHPDRQAVSPLLYLGSHRVPSVSTKKIPGSLQPGTRRLMTSVRG